jgi:hypothetical protein
VNLDKVGDRKRKRNAGVGAEKFKHGGFAEGFVCAELGQH